MNFLKPLLLDATQASGDTTSPEAPWWQNFVMPVMLVVMGLFMYFVMIRPQRKRQKEEQKMRGDIRIGDQITTIGGISGRVLKVSEEEITLETGADRTKVTFKKWAIQTNETVHDAPADDDDDDDI